MATIVVIPTSAIFPKSSHTHDTDASTIHSLTECLPVESLSEAICRCSGNEVIRAVKQTILEAAGEEGCPGIGLWAAVETAYFRDVKPADLKKDRDDEEFAYEIGGELLGDLGHMSLIDMETSYQSSLASTHTEVLMRLWELYEALPASLPYTRPGQVISSIQSPDFQATASSFLRYLETHSKLSPADEEICAVCTSPESTEENLIVICSKCDLAVHANCYGIGTIPEGDWLCEPCKRGRNDPACCLCLQGKGAMYRVKRSECGEKWAHITCAQLIPTNYLIYTNSKSIINIKPDLLPSKSPCSFCGLAGGALLKCDYRPCLSRFHPTCWRNLILAQGGQPIPPVFCGLHNHDGLRAALEESVNRQSREINRLWYRLANCAREDEPRKRRKTSY